VQDPAGDQVVQPGGEGRPGDPEPVVELVEPAHAVEDRLPQHEPGPGVADRIDGAEDGAGAVGGFRDCAHRRHDIVLSLA